MWDTNTVSELSEGVLSKKDAIEVIKQYNSLCEKYPDVRNDNA
jgi:acyl-CoA synthetase (NDP forming)